MRATSAVLFPESISRIVATFISREYCCRGISIALSIQCNWPLIFVSHFGGALHPLPPWGFPLLVIEKSLNCTSRQRLRKSRKGPHGYGRHTSGQIDRNLSLVSHVTQQRAKSGHEQLRTSRAETVGTALDKIGYVLGTQFGKT